MNDRRNIINTNHGKLLKNEGEKLHSISNKNKNSSCS